MVEHSGGVGEEDFVEAGEQPFEVALGGGIVDAGGGFEEDVEALAEDGFGERTEEGNEAVADEGALAERLSGVSLVGGEVAAGIFLPIGALAVNVGWMRGMRAYRKAARAERSAPGECMSSAKMTSDSTILVSVRGWVPSRATAVPRRASGEAVSARASTKAS